MQEERTSVDSFLQRRTVLRALGVGAASLALPQAFGAPATQPARLPNIVVILADDMGYGDLSCQNPQSKIATPHLDRLAAEGVRFCDAHASAAVSTPSRYSLLTGRYCWRTTRLPYSVLGSWDQALIEPGRQTMGDMLRQAGYHTACIGKWHLGMDWSTNDGKPPVEDGSNVDFHQKIRNGPTTHGFDYYFGVDLPNMPPYCFIENDHTVGIPSEQKPGSMFGWPGPMLPGWDLERILPILTQKAVAFIKAPTNKDRPFFLYFSLTAPHTPIAPSAEFKGKSKAGPYGDFICELDACVGRVLQALKDGGLADNTLVIFTSDNGSPRMDGMNMGGDLNSELRYGQDSSYPWRGIKTDIWDGGHREPFLARWPGHIRPGSVSRETICLSDLMATFAAITGRKLANDAGEDSYNILPALLGQEYNKPIREATVHQSERGMFAVRQGRWKLILGRGSGGWTVGDYSGPAAATKQLYDLAADPYEKDNLYLQHPEVVKRLTALLEKYRKEGRSTPPRN